MSEVSSNKTSNQASGTPEAKENTDPGSPEFPDIERQARLNGWVPEDQFRGDPDAWVSADEFVQRGKEINPILRANNKRLMERIDEVARQNKELQATLTEFGEHHKKTAEKAYAAALETLRKEKREAIEAGDTVTALNLSDRIDDLKESRESSLLKEKEPGRKSDRTDVPPIEQDPALIAWTRENRWFGDDKVRTQLAMMYGEELHNEYPELRGKAFLDELDARLVAEFPGKFKGGYDRNPRRENASMTVGIGAPATSVSGRRGRSFNDLPLEAKAACKKFVAQKLLTQEQYLKDYFGDEEDG